VKNTGRFPPREHTRRQASGSAAVHAPDPLRTHRERGAGRQRAGVPRARRPVRGLEPQATAEARGGRRRGRGAICEAPDPEQDAEVAERRAKLHGYLARLPEADAALVRRVDLEARPSSRSSESWASPHRRGPPAPPRQGEARGSRACERACGGARPAPPSGDGRVDRAGRSRNARQAPPYERGAAARRLSSGLLAGAARVSVCARRASFRARGNSA
jgi:hypothetical protein